jgi:PAS domain S-box-containing protein
MNGADTSVPRARPSELESVLEVIPAAIWLTRDRNCARVTGNAAACRLFRQPEGSNLSFGGQNGDRLSAEFEMWSAGRKLPADELPLRRAVRGECVRDFELEVRYPHGGARCLVGNATPLFDEAGKLFGAIAAFVDVTERKRYSDAQEHLASIVEYSDDAIISKDLNGIILSWNRGAERLFGYTAEEAVGQPITMLIPEHRIDEEPEILRRIRAGERIDHYETVRRRKDGTPVDISLSVSPMRDANGAIVAASKIGRDIADRKKAEAQRSLLTAELNHRVKNTLATVIAIARQSFAGAEIGEARNTFNARIRGLAQTHSRLAEADWASVSLNTLFTDEFAPYQREGYRNVTLSGTEVELSPKCALTLGLAIHELATNAAKYGALSSEGGIVHVSWSIDPRDKSLDITWTENGGPQVCPPERTGFGRLLLERALAADLQSEVRLDFDPRGLRCRLRIPAPQYQARA